MGDCQLDDLLDMLDDDEDFEEAAVDDPGPADDPEPVAVDPGSADECQEDVEEEGDDEEEMAKKIRQMEEEVCFNRNHLRFPFLFV